MTNSGIHAVIPARGGSKRLPGKNLRPLAGVPLIVHSIRYGLNHPLVRRVWVTTDDEHIAEVASVYGATVIERPAALATDHARTSAVLQHAIAAFDPSDDVNLVATLQPTSPLRLPRWLTDCVSLLDDQRFDSAITVSPVSTKLGTVDDQRFQPGYEVGTRSQDMHPKFRENGAIYVTRRSVGARGSVFGEVIGAVVTDHLFAAVDIDDLADFEQAALLARTRG